MTLSKLNVPDEPEAEYAKILNLAFGSSLSAVTALKPKDIVPEFLKLVSRI
jgi:hypothetical protein